MATPSSDNEGHIKSSPHSDGDQETEDPANDGLLLLPEDVLCDSCMDGPTKAEKSCLTCLVSYCEAHLRPHLENAKFQNHRLVAPLHDIDCHMCALHHLPLKRFCLEDGCCLCLECESQQHEGHATRSLEEARTEKESELQNKHKLICEAASAAEKAIGNLDRNNDLIKSSVQELCSGVEEQFAMLQAVVEEARKGAVEVLEGEQKQALRQAAGIQAHLEQKRVELEKTDAQLNKLSTIKSDVDFLQEYSEWKKGETDVCVPRVSVTRMTHLTSYAQVVTDATQELCEMISSSYRKKLSTINKSTKLMMPATLQSSLPDPQTREEFLKYIKSLTFDPVTTHNFLRLMEGNRKLTNTSPWQHSYPEHPDRFEYWRQAMSSESLYLGRHYIEAELSGEGAHVGVTYKSIPRKEEHSTSCITGSAFSWCIGRNSRGFSVFHAGAETVLEVEEISRIGLYLNFDQGCVSFYSVSDDMRLLHSYTTDFTEPLYVTVWLSKKDNVVSLIHAQ
ncbi:tripartite motif-containing protein 16-like [Gouania willdenowi]|uniref:Tripartite motif-containing protein 16-like n=1 Tax=Gouania willdenowi TaxID=441366 RepID=A0A8C5GYQ9_GOUWI|nr:tripartite motif-containing protein 16-like [Gouania willdenowi]XP_028310941.1 tripartite motif-containing protein 16-like [Gouania willdenowi]